jgi:hypothetical protein
LEDNHVVQVYRNLNAQQLFSIRDRKTGLVLAHGDRFLVGDVTCKVREGGRQRVIKEGRKNVHAFLNCIYLGECKLDVKHLDELYYDPYKHSTFINKRTFEPIETLHKAYFEDGKAYIIP